MRGNSVDTYSLRGGKKQKNGESRSLE